MCLVVQGDEVGRAGTESSSEWRDRTGIMKMPIRNQ